jgi:hypothetical protein
MSDPSRENSSKAVKLNQATGQQLDENNADFS